MSQSSIRKSAQHQDVELWEMYEEDERSVAAHRQNRNDRRSSRNETRRRDGQGSRQNRKAARSNRDRETTKNGVRNSRDRVVVKSAGRDRQDRQAMRGADRDRQDRQTARGADRDRQDRQTARSARRNSRDREYGRANSVYSQDASRMRTRDVSRSGNISQISYIQPYSETQRRRNNPEYAYRGNARPVQSIKRRRARRRREFLCKMAILLFVVICLGMIYYITGQIYQMVHRRTEEKPLPVMTEQAFDNKDNTDSDSSVISPPGAIQDFLEINEYSRPGTRLDRINSIFVHYTANPGTSAAQNRSYFANLAETHERSASAHLIIGYDGELIQCIPFDEQAYAVMTRNEDSISIECCYLADDGSFTQETYDTLIHTLAWLLKEYNLTTDDILRHYDCGGKKCPLYYTENEGEWEQLRQDVATYMETTQ